jgi:hypothetical protein
MSNFSLRLYIKQGMLDAVGHLNDYQIILNSAGWADKGVLEESDLADIQAAIDAKNAQVNTDNIDLESEE